MTALLGVVVTGLTGAVCLLVVSLTAVRMGIRRRGRRERQLRPRMSQAVARYATGSGARPRPGGRAEREALRRVAVETLTDLRGAERDLLVELMEQLGFVDEAAAALGSRLRSTRRRAAELLALIASSAPAPALIAGLCDKDPLVRTSCARTLAEIGDVSLAPRIAAIAEADIRAAPGAASAVVLALAHRSPDALAWLLRPAAPPQVRKVAVEVAGRLRLAGLSPLLRGCLADGGEDLVAAAAEGCGLIGDVEAAPALSGIARDRRRAVGVRADAVSALGAIGDPGSVGLLEGLLEDGEWPLRSAAARSLAWLGGEGAAALRRAASSPNPAVREQAEAAMAR